MSRRDTPLKKVKKLVLGGAGYFRYHFESKFALASLGHVLLVLHLPVSKILGRVLNGRQYL